MWCFCVKSNIDCYFENESLAGLNIYWFHRYNCCLGGGGGVQKFKMAAMEQGKTIRNIVPFNCIIVLSSDEDNINICK
jgi:hypothetical protein